MYRNDISQPISAGARYRWCPTPKDILRSPAWVSPNLPEEGKPDTHKLVAAFALFALVVGLFGCLLASSLQHHPDAATHPVNTPMLVLT